MGLKEKFINKFAEVFADKALSKISGSVRDKTGQFNSDKFIALLRVVGDLFNRPISKDTESKIKNAWEGNSNEAEEQNEDDS